MAVKFHVFANGVFLKVVEANRKTGALRKFLSSLDGNCTPHYGYRSSTDHHPELDGWYTMHGLSPIKEECVPPTIRMLHLLMNY